MDTNIISEIVKNPHTYFRGISTLLGKAPTLLCFSPYTLFELRVRKDVYARFVEMFDVYPCALLKNEEQLVEAEAEAYDTGVPVDPLLFPFSYFNKGRGTNLKNLLDLVFASGPVAQRESAWPAMKHELLSDWIALKRNYPPKGRTYLPTEAREFARRVTMQQIAERVPDFFAERTSRAEIVDVKRFPSLMMTSLSVFFRLYEPLNRKPTPQDVFDVLISTPTPYLDVVVTEKMQTSILDKAKRLLPAVRDVEVFSLRHVRDSCAELLSEG